MRLYLRLLFAVGILLLPFLFRPPTSGWLTFEARSSQSTALAITLRLIDGFRDDATAAVQVAEGETFRPYRVRASVRQLSGVRFVTAEAGARVELRRVQLRTDDDQLLRDIAPAGTVAGQPLLLTTNPAEVLRAIICQQLIPDLGVTRSLMLLLGLPLLLTLVLRCFALGDPLFASLAKLRPENAVLALGLIFGLTLVACNPPFQSGDAAGHFFRAWQVSEGTVVGERKADRVGGHLPTSLGILVTPWLKDVRDHPEKRLTVADLTAQASLALRPEERTFLEFPTTAIFSPVPYLPQAAGITAGRLAGATPLVAYYLGRLANLLAYLLLAYLAVRSAHGQPWLFAMVALMPMPLFLSTSLSPDAVTIGLSLLFVSLVTAAASANEPPTLRSLWLLVPLAVAVALTKHAYVFILPLAFLVPRRLFPSGRRYAAWLILLFGLAACAWGLWAHVATTLFVPVRPGADPTARLAFMQANPVAYLKTLVLTWRHLGPGILQSAVGNFAWHDVPMNITWTALYPLALVFVALVDQNRPASRGLPLTGKLLAAACFVTGVTVVTTTLYLSWTPVGHTTIRGLQGRHFLPYLPLFFLVLQNHRFKRVFDEVKPVFPLLLLASLGAAVSTIVGRYY